MPIPTTPSPVRAERRMLPATVYDYVLALIGDGSLIAGEKIDDVAVAERMGVSRATVRQALNRLADVGLVEMAPNRYTRVAMPSPERFAATIEVAVVLWRLGASLAMRNPAPGMSSQFDRLVAVVNSDIAEVPNVDGSDFIGHVIDVFEFFSACSGNAVLVDASARLRPIITHTARLGAAAYDLPGTASLLQALRSAVAGNDARAIDRALASIGGMADEFLERSAQP